MPTDITQAVNNLRIAVQDNRRLRIVKWRAMVNTFARKQPAETINELLVAIHQTIRIAADDTPDRYIQATIDTSALSIPSDVYAEHLAVSSEGERSTLVQEFLDATTNGNADYNVPASLVTYLITLVRLTQEELLAEIAAEDEH